MGLDPVIPCCGMSCHPIVPGFIRGRPDRELAMVVRQPIHYSDRTRRNSRGQPHAIRSRIPRKTPEIPGRTLRPRRPMVAPIGNRTTDRTVTDRPAGYTLTATDPGSGGWTGGTTESPATANLPTRVGRRHPRRIHHGRHRQAMTSLSRAKWITC
jgi:hypothetical protein